MAVILAFVGLIIFLVGLNGLLSAVIVNPALSGMMVVFGVLIMLIAGEK